MDPSLKVLFTGVITDYSSCNHEDSVDNMSDGTPHRQTDTNMTEELFSEGSDHFYRIDLDLFIYLLIHFWFTVFMKAVRSMCCAGS